MNTRFFGQYLLEKGRITSQQLLEGLECQRDITAPILVFALEKGLVTTAQIGEVLEQSRKSKQDLGELVRDMGILEQPQIDALAADAESGRRLRLGEALMLKGFISVETLDKELKEYHTECERLSAEISLAFSNLAHQKIVKTFTDLILIMFNQFSKQDIVVEHCQTGKENVRLFRWVIAQKIAGETLRFNCLISVPPKLLLQMASTMLDESITVPDELALDATKEFVNIANGNACAKLSEDGVSLRMAPPEVFETTTTPYPIHAKEIVCVHLAVPDAKLEVAFEF